MPQEFFKDTLISRFIKHLVATSEIPLPLPVKDGDIVVAGQHYIYKIFVIECVTTGVLNIANESLLYPSDKLYPSVVLFPNTGMKSATYKIISYYEWGAKKLYTYTYHANVGYYDSETHKHLGRYLRHLSYQHDQDYMQYYNCFNNTYIQDFSLQLDGYNVTYVLKSNPRIKVLGIPIRFNTTYTISLDCPAQVLMRSVIYDNGSGMVRKSLTNNDEYLSDDLDYSGKILNSCSFLHPFTYKVETSSSRLASQEHNLYLVLQVPTDCTSAIVAIEGTNYRVPSADVVEKISCITNGEHNIRNHSVDSQLLFSPSLLSFNTQKSYAFSDKLIEYLLLNVITKNETLSGNIARTQKSLSKIDDIYAAEINKGTSRPGVWDKHIEQAIKRLIQKNIDTASLSDYDLTIDTRVEELINKEEHRIVTSG